MKNRELVEWLHEQPEIKRRALAYESRMLAQSYNLFSTAQAIATMQQKKRSPQEE